MNSRPISQARILISTEPIGKIIINQSRRKNIEKETWCLGAMVDEKACPKMRESGE
jgi:hypothetical protein